MVGILKMDPLAKPAGRARDCPDGVHGIPQFIHRSGRRGLLSRTSERLPSGCLEAMNFARDQAANSAQITLNLDRAQSSKGRYACALTLLGFQFARHCLRLESNADTT
ncbi:hypothetical protein H9L21_15080 [Aeromicrobium senzhongii]|uniref:Uncharacterized protein n=1 Tax=Aeromicrobium senzhongii TaxID=2663859 RepID=A0ABX6SUW2_9ACTN|nr:hypothetical protein [Aeromicrobium senzhongii]MTB89489.1 hypothetical protein [Aeromicrobium senzhongii]QNL94377.1 hypothetical protein H9L21_15080 [Aeromicrobium senzhongii]